MSRNRVDSEKDDEASHDPWCSWSREEDKLFEQALLLFAEDSPQRWVAIADLFPSKSPTQIIRHYEALERDVMDIEAGRIPIPRYSTQQHHHYSFGSSDRKRGTPWTQEEHRLFLEGLRMYGKGDWRSISRNVVVTRTPTQVASHAQKYFLRQEKGGRSERKRSSIHDITYYQ